MVFILLGFPFGGLIAAALLIPTAIIFIETGTLFPHHALIGALLLALAF